MHSSWFEEEGRRGGKERTYKGRCRMVRNMFPNSPELVSNSCRAENVPGRTTKPARRIQVKKHERKV